jgi:Ca2+:H+ antiporter
VGSILSNSLLVLGSSLIYGGYYHNGKDGPGYQSYNPLGAGAANSLMVFSSLGLILPTMYKGEIQEAESTLTISRAFSVFLLFSYGQYLWFQLKTHGHFFQGENDEDDDDGKKLTQTCAGGTLFVLTILTSFCSEFLIRSIEGAIQQWNVSREFIGIILLPIIGNAAEHYSAILFAGKDRMNLTLSVAMGSAVQMALLATPMTVVFGWILGKPVDLNFHQFQVVVYVLSVILVANVLKDGTANWLEGCVLVTAYICIALIYFYENNGFSTTIMVTGTTVYDFN